MFLKLLVNSPSKLIEARFIMFDDQGAQQRHVIARPEFVDSLFAGPGIPVSTRLAQKIILGLVHTLLYLAQINMQIELLADLLTDLCDGWIGTQQRKTRIKEDGTDSLWLFKWHGVDL